MNTPATGETTSTCTVHWPATSPDCRRNRAAGKRKAGGAGNRRDGASRRWWMHSPACATTTVPGKPSVNVVPVAAAGLLLIRMTVSVDVWPAETLTGLNVLLTPIAANAADGDSRAIASRTLRTKLQPRDGCPRKRQRANRATDASKEDFSWPAIGQSLSRRGLVALAVDASSARSGRIQRRLHPPKLAEMVAATSLITKEISRKSGC